jgi:hypothetical protein
MARQNFSRPLRDTVLRWNATELIHVVSGIMIVETHIADKERGLIQFCENCKFCQTDRAYFDVDHLVPDREMRGSGRRSDVVENAVVLCKSYEKGARGCNQTKGGRLWPPPDAGLARTRPELDLNWMPMHLRDANTLWPS